MNTKHVLKHALLACAAAYFAAPPSAQATPSLLSYAQVYFSNASNSAILAPMPCSNLTTTAATMTCNGTTQTPDFSNTQATLNYDSTATAGYGILKAGGAAYTSGANGNSDTTYFSTSQGYASFEDTWTITGGTGTGTLELQFALDGSYDFCDNHSGIGLGLRLANITDHSSAYFSPGAFGTSCYGTISPTATLSTAFTFGAPTDFSVGLDATSSLYDLGKNISSYVNFADTATMSSIIVKDSSGNTLSSFGLTTDSGASLFSQLAPSGTPAANAVPEPPSLTLFGFGLLSLLGVGSIRRRGRAKRAGSGDRQVTWASRVR